MDGDEFNVISCAFEEIWTKKIFPEDWLNRAMAWIKTTI